MARIEQQPLPVKAERKAAPSLKPQATAQSVSFAKSSVPPDTFPYNIWARLLRNTLTTADEHALISDTSAGGVLPLRQALARHLYQFRGLNIAPEQIIIGAGTQTLYNLIVQPFGTQPRLCAGKPRLSAVGSSLSGQRCFLPLSADGCPWYPRRCSGKQRCRYSAHQPFAPVPYRHCYACQPPLRIAALGSKKNAAVISSKMITTANSACSASLFRHCRALIPKKKVIYINTFSKTAGTNLPYQLHAAATAPGIAVL